MIKISIDEYKEVLDFFSSCELKEENDKSKINFILSNEKRINKKLFRVVNSMIFSIGGRYSAKHTGWVFKKNPEDRIHQIITGDKYDKKKNHEIILPNDSIIDLIIDGLKIQTHDEIIIPYAGEGYLSKKIIERHPDVTVTNIELKKEYAEKIEEQGMKVINTDFLKMPVAPYFDIAVGILPGIKNQNKDYFVKMIKCVKDGGRVSAYMPSKFIDSENADLKDFKKFVNYSNAEYLPVDEKHCILSLTINQSNNHLRYI